MARLARRRVHVTTANLEERIAGQLADTALANEALERAAASWRRVTAVDIEDDVPASARTRDASNLARILIRLGRLDDAVQALPDGPDREALRAEVLRRKGDPKGAREVLRPALAARPTPSCWAVDALIAADLGEMDRARKSLALLVEVEKEGPLLDDFRSANVRARIER